MIRRSPRWLVAALLLLGVVGCGEQEGSAARTPGREAVVPTCADVWVVGHVLPPDYFNCLEPGQTLDDLPTTIVSFPCGNFEAGRNLFSYRTLAGVTGEVIRVATEDPDLDGPDSATADCAASRPRPSGS